MKTLARAGIVACSVTYLHLVFGGLVRITGSGMGCGDQWPKCNGSWIPPFDNAAVMIEYTHRLLATLVLLSIVVFVLVAWRRRVEPGVEGRGGVLPAAKTALLLVIGEILLGMVTVKLGNRPIATVAHWTLAMTLLAVLIAATARAGALGGHGARIERRSRRTVNSLGAGAVLAFVAVVLGGLVAKLPGASLACPSVPLCGSTPASIPAAYGTLQMTHRAVAYLLFFHVLGVTLAMSRRPAEARPVKNAATTAATLVVLQLVVGIAMIAATLPPVLRSLHEAIGVGVWMTLFLAGYLARMAAHD